MLKLTSAPRGQWFCSWAYLMCSICLEMCFVRLTNRSKELNEYDRDSIEPVLDCFVPFWGIFLVQIIRIVASLNTFIRDESNNAELRSTYGCTTRHCYAPIALIRADIKLVLLLDLFMPCCHRSVQVFECFSGYRYHILRSRHVGMINYLNKQFNVNGYLQRCTIKQEISGLPFEWLILSHFLTSHRLKADNREFK